jgi:hypothetical protein
MLMGADGRCDRQNPVRERDRIGKGKESVTENERRAADSLQLGDVVLRGACAIAIIVGALAALLAIQPA